MMMLQHEFVGGFPILFSAAWQSTEKHKSTTRCGATTFLWDITFLVKESNAQFCHRHLSSGLPVRGPGKAHGIQARFLRPPLQSHSTLREGARRRSLRQSPSQLPLSWV
jgi:hypothetical protein